MVASVGVALIPLVHSLTGSLDALFAILLVSAIGGTVAGFALPAEAAPARVALVAGGPSAD